MTINRRPRNLGFDPVTRGHFDEHGKGFVSHPLAAKTRQLGRSARDTTDGAVQNHLQQIRIHQAAKDEQRRATR
jgi:hypothetical protein